MDEPFPEVPPDAGPEQIIALGAALVFRIVALAPAAAMIQGEFTLVFYLVNELELRGIPCYAATTRRVTEIAKRPDGNLEKRSLFEFVRFRRYPRASGT